MRDMNGANTRRVTALLGFTGDSAALAPLIELLYSTDDATQLVAWNALLYFDPQRLRGERARHHVGGVGGGSVHAKRGDS